MDWNCLIKRLHYNDILMSMMASQITSLTIVYSTVYSGPDQRKHQSSASLAFVRGIHWSPVNSPHKGTVTWKMFLFDDVIMGWRIRGWFALVSVNQLGPINATWQHTSGSTLDQVNVTTTEAQPRLWWHLGVCGVTALTEIEVSISILSWYHKINFKFGVFVKPNCLSAAQV